MGRPLSVQGLKKYKRSLTFCTLAYIISIFFYIISNLSLPLLYLKSYSITTKLSARGKNHMRIKAGVDDYISTQQQLWNPRPKVEPFIPNKRLKETSQGLSPISKEYLLKSTRKQHIYAIISYSHNQVKKYSRRMLQ